MIAFGTTGGTALGALFLGLVIRGIVFATVDDADAGVCFGVGASVGGVVGAFIGLIIATLIYHNCLKKKRTEIN